MSSFMITPEAIQNAARDKMLSGHFEKAKEFLKKNLIGINDSQVNMILEGESILIGTENGMSLFKKDDEEYKKTLDNVRKEIENSEDKRNLIIKEELRDLYRNNFLEFISYKTEENFVSFPKSLMDDIIGKEGKCLPFKNLSNKEQLKILIPQLNDNTLVNFKLFRENEAFGRLNKDLGILHSSFLWAG